MIATIEIVGLAEWIIDDTCLMIFFFTLFVGGKFFLLDRFTAAAHYFLLAPLLDLSLHIVKQKENLMILCEKQLRKKVGQ